jgi:hypothetical protein
METKEAELPHETVSTSNQFLYGKISDGINTIQDDGQDFNLEKHKTEVRRPSMAARTLRFLTSLKSTLVENNPEERHGFPLISKDNPVKKIFDIYMLILVQYSVITSLYFLGYEHPTGDLLNFDYFVWACFILDFLLKFITKTTLKGRPVNSFQGIVFKYFRAWMILDIASLLPLHFSGHPNAEYWLRLFRVFKMPKLIVMIPMNNLIRSFVERLKFIDHRTSKRLVIVLNFFWSLIYQILGMLFTSYSLACIWMYYIRIVKEYKNEKPNFEDDYGYELLTNGEQLIKTWYFIYTTLMTVGYGDLSARNKYEMGFCILLLIIGPTMYAYSMGKATDTINRLKNSGKNDERVGDSEIWVSSIELNYGKLRPKLKQKILEHFNFYFNNDRARVLAEKHWNYQESDSYLSFHNSFLNSIPENLRCKILDHLFKDIFYKFKVFFGDKDDFRYFVCLHIQPRIYRKGAYVIKENTIPTEVMFLEEGEVRVGLKINGEFSSLYEYKKKSVLGDYFVYFDEPSFARYVVYKRSTGFALPGKVIKKVGKAFPGQFTIIKNLAEKKASIIKRTIHDQIGTDDDKNGNYNDNQTTYPKPSKLNTRITKGRPSILKPAQNDSSALADLSKILNNSKRKFGNLAAELDEKLNELIELKKESN